MPCCDIILWLLCVFLYVAHAQVCDYNFAGVRDIVFLFDVSPSVGRSVVNQCRDASSRFVTSNLIVRRSQARVAAITFSGNYSVVVDTIEETGDIRECELLDHWEKNIVFKGVTGEKLGDAMRRAESIFHEGRRMRPGVKQQLLIFTEAHHFSLEAQNRISIVGAKNDLEFTNVTIYGIAVPNNVRQDEVVVDYEFFRDEIVTKPPCLLNISEWTATYTATTVLAKQRLKLAEDDDEGFVPTVDVSLCGETCDEGEACFCREFYTDFECREAQDEDENDDDDDDVDWVWIVIYVFIALASLGLLAGLGAALWRIYVTIKDQTHPNRHLDDSRIPTDANTYSNQTKATHEQLYVNGIAQTMFDGHFNQPPNAMAPEPPVTARSGSYIQPQNNADPDEDHYANVRSRGWDGVPRTDDDADHAYVNNAYETSGQTQSSRDDRAQGGHEETATTLRPKSTGKWKGTFSRLFESRLSKAKSRDYENEEVINDLHKTRTQPQKDQRKLGTKRFSNFRQMFERTNQTAGRPAVENATYGNGGNSMFNVV